MTAMIIPDPYHPQGGWCLMHLAGQGGATVTVAIRDLSSEEWLSADGWQPAQTTLGVFDVSPSGDILFGPAIVDRIEPYAALEVIVEGQKTRLTWPDTIATSPAGLQSGGLQVTRRREKSALEGTSAKPVVSPSPELEPEPVEQFSAAPEAELEKTDRAPRRLPFLIFGLLGLAAIAALLAYLFLFPTPPPVAPDTVAEEEATDCSSEGFAGRATRDYAEQLAVAVECDASTSPDDLLRILESGVRANQPDALLRMARLYDPMVAADGGIELSRRDPAIAAEYYGRAAAAGSADTDTALSEVCALLEPENLLHDTVRAQYCP
jgi:hypothetical protein